VAREVLRLQLARERAGELAVHELEVEGVVEHVLDAGLRLSGEVGERQLEAEEGTQTVKTPFLAPPRRLASAQASRHHGGPIVMGPSVPSRRVTRALDELVAVHGCPLAVRVENGPEFAAQSFVDWCTEHVVAIHYIQPRKPDQEAYIERFNRSYRTEVLNAHLFESVAELRALTEPGYGFTIASGLTIASAACRR
jgi:hypothetical protein